MKSWDCEGALADFLGGVHAPGDDYRMALYTPKAGISPMTETYTPNGEVQSAGYPAGGLSLGPRRIVWDAKNEVATMLFPGPINFTGAQFRAGKALVYNATKNRAISVFEFGPVDITFGVFRVDQVVAMELARTNINGRSKA